MHRELRNGNTKCAVHTHLQECGTRFNIQGTAHILFDPLSSYLLWHKIMSSFIYESCFLIKREIEGKIDNKTSTPVAAAVNALLISCVN